MTNPVTRIAVCRRGTLAGLVFALATVAAGDAQVPFEQVVANLRSADASQRLTALRQLREASYAEAIEPVAALLTDPDARVQAAAIDTELSFFLARPLAVKRATGAEAAFDAGPEAMAPREVPPPLADALLAAVQRTEPGVQVQVLYLMGALLRPPVTPAVQEELLQLIGRSTPPVRRAAARVAGRLQVTAAGEDLIYRLNDPELGVRVGAMEALAWLREARAVAALAALVEYHGHKGEGLPALETLARIGHASSVPVFVPRLADRNAEVRRMAAEGLGRAGATAQMGALEARLGDERSPVVRLALAFALHRLGRPSLPTLVQALSDKDRRAQAHRYLVDLGSAEVATLQDYLRSPDPDTRAQVASVLGAIGDARAIPALEGLAGDPDDDVRTIAADAVQRLRLRGR